MSKIAKLFKAMGLIVKQPSLLNKVLDDEQVNQQEVIQKYGLEKGLPTVFLCDLLPNFEQTVVPYASMDGGSTPLDLGLLKGLAASKPLCTYFEIGTWRGESVANVAAVANKCYTLNLSDEALLQLGLNKKYVALHRYFSKRLPNVEHLFGNSLNFDFSAYQQKMDLVFVDGDHHYESVKKDTESAFRLLKDNRSMIVWHDYGNTPADVRWDVLKGILDGTPPEKRKFLYRVSNTLCAVYTEQPLSSRYPDSFEDPTTFFELKIKARS